MAGVCVWCGGVDVPKELRGFPGLGADPSVQWSLLPGERALGSASAPAALPGEPAKPGWQGTTGAKNQGMRGVIKSGIRGVIKSGIRGVIKSGIRSYQIREEGE